MNLNQHTPLQMPNYQEQSFKTCFLCKQSITDSQYTTDKPDLGEVHYDCAKVFESTLDDSEG